MRRMSTRQANLYVAGIILAIALSACAATEVPPTTPTVPPPSATPTIFVTSSPSPTPTTTPLVCLNQPGRVLEDLVADTVPPQSFIIYLPPCYENSTERYPALYLLHGQTYTQDQWLRLGAAKIADKLIHSGATMPFIMVFPDDRYWNSPAGGEFGNRLIYNLIPYVDARYRTRPEKKFRALGGLSRGGGWTARIGFDRPDLFGALGFHSPALFKDNAPYLEAIIQSIPEDERPQLWHDTGDADSELGNSLIFEETLQRLDYPHEFRRFVGEHTERYWSAHTLQYLQWYTDVWRENELAR